MLRQFLRQLHLSDKEAEIYLALLEIGQNSAATVAKYSKLPRTTIYDLLKNLKQKGFIESIEKNSVLSFRAKAPELLGAVLERQLQEIDLKKRQFQKLLPEFQRLALAANTLPKVRYFEGLDGIKEVYEDTLTAKEKLSYSCAPAVTGPLRQYLDQYLKQRIKLRLRVRSIFPDSPAARKEAKDDKKLLRQTRLVPAAKYPFHSEISIYDNKVSYTSLSGNLHGVIIESDQIASTERSIFELAWLGAATLVQPKPSN